jgi:hypothetical protein
MVKLATAKKWREGELLREMVGEKVRMRVQRRGKDWLVPKEAAATQRCRDREHSGYTTTNDV